MPIGRAPKQYLLVCEIGPIFHFVRRSRKAKDYWAASFLFSYLMCQIAKFVKHYGVIIRPNLEGDLMCNDTLRGERKVKAGSIPDQIYVVIPAEKKEEVKCRLKKEFERILEEIIRDVKEKNGMNSVYVDMNEVHEYFNLFFIFHSIKASYPSYDEFVEAEEKIKARSLAYCFTRQNRPGVKKWDKCDLCGERAQVYTVNHTATDLTDRERICSVCILKRFLYKAVDAIASEPKYESTSDIAAVPINRRYSELKNKPDVEANLKAVEDKYDRLVSWCRSNTSELFDVKNTIKFSEPLGRCLFVESPLLKEFRDSFKKLEEKDGSLPTPWLERPFYAVVYMDGDNMGSAFKDSGKYFKEVSNTVSSVLTKFTHKAEDIVSQHSGQLIYAGGDDVNFMIHPEYLTGCVEELANTYRQLFAEGVAQSGDNLPQSIKEKLLNLSLSTGAVVCYHKYPLSEAIKRSYQTLTDKAKKVKGKNAIAVQLIKGHTETFTVAIPNALLKNVAMMKERIADGTISRTTPYRLREEEHLLDQLLMADPEKFKKYLGAELETTRGKKRDKKEVGAIVEVLKEIALVEDNSGKFSARTMIDVLLYLQFLTGRR